MYGLIGKIIVLEGKADELAEILIRGIANMPGCLSYIVAKDSIEANSVWVTEVWKVETSTLPHWNFLLSLMPSVKVAL